ncbi:hypothetical protein CFK40_10480 [Virgibacillus necropolis]|uniref:Permease n=1 Tax=Virgibacillus necropolis TaxID=163877 RepID=A0A221MCK8_9BACI|nr:hypothetical protein CFK40_10480 [Virgibacillus necropolis]
MEKKFEFSFNNKRVRVWFILVIPFILLSIVLSFLLPRGYHLIPVLIPVIVISTYWIWVLLQRKSRRM